MAFTLPLRLVGPEHQQMGSCVANTDQVEVIGLSDSLFWALQK